MTDATYQNLLDWAQQFSTNRPADPVDGEYYDMPGTTVYTTARQALQTGGRLEVNLTTPDAQKEFSWQAELTIDDLANQRYQHILLQTDGTVVETYGKQVIPVDTGSAQKILADLKELSAA